MTMEEYEICHKKGNTIVLPETFEDIALLPKKMDLLDTLTVVKECVENKTPAWFFTSDFENMMPTRVRARVEKKNRVSEEHAKLGSILDIDFSDFMDEEELKRLEKTLEKIRPSELMY